jgi:AmiR/NasT family two-component response regulator
MTTGVASEVLGDPGETPARLYVYVNELRNVYESETRTVPGEENHHLRVLIADQDTKGLLQMEQIVRDLGYDVIARAIDPSKVAHATRAERPDVALVALGESSDHALTLISNIVHESICPVIAVLDVQNPAFVTEAARRGIFAYIDHADREELKGAIEVVLHRFAEFRDLEGAFGRRAIIERAKGILMERHSITERDAFELLRRHSQRTGRKLADVADAVASSHLMLPGPPRPSPDTPTSH